MYSLVYTVCSDEDEARKIAMSLVDEKLVACANFFPIQSVYRWKGCVQQGHEFAMILKSKTSLKDQIIARIEELHSYDTPAILSVELSGGSERFFDWIDAETDY